MNDTRGAPPNTGRIALGAVAALCVLATWNALYFFPITVDDAFISLRYAWNLVEGDGFVFNPGERVEGYSNPSWTLLAAAWLALGIEPLEALKWCGVLLVGVLPAVAFWSSRRLGLTPLWSLLPAGLAAVDLNLAFWAPNGLETPLWAVLLAAWPGLLARRWFDGERLPVSALVGAALYVTRPEAPLFIAPAILVEAALALRDPSRRKTAFVWAAALAVPCLAWLGFRVAYYGDWVANTFYVKANDGFQPEIFKKYLASWLVVNAPMTGALLALSAPLALRTRGGRLALAALAIQFLFVLRAGGDWMAQNRFWGPAVPLAAYVIATGAQSLVALLVARATGPAPRFGVPQIVALAVVLPLLPQAWRHLTLEFLYLDNGKPSVVARWEGNTKTTMERVTGPFRTGVPDRVAKVLLYVPDGGTLAHSEIGLLAYVSDNPMLDAFGLVDKRLSGATGEKLDDVIATLPPPDYLLMREQVPMLTKMTKTAWYAERGYAERQRWQNVWLETPTGVGADPLPPAAAFVRLDRAVERVPRDVTFHLARIELARAVGDRAREAGYCAAAGAAIPSLANVCKGGGAPAPKADSVAFRPFVAQTPNGGFEAATAGKPDGWTPVPGDATTYEVATEGMAVGAGALRITGSQWVCAPWAPVKGNLRVAGKVRTDDITGAKNERQGAAVSLRIRKAGEKGEELPVLKAWTGTNAWTDFALTWLARPEYTEYRACLGLNNAQGAAWFDEVTAGTEDLPEGAAVTAVPAPAPAPPPAPPPATP